MNINDIVTAIETRAPYLRERTQEAVLDLKYRFRASRYGLAYHVLRGRPLAYGITFEGPVVVDKDHTTFRECTFRGTCD
jgi:hypothetical protein